MVILITSLAQPSGQYVATLARRAGLTVRALMYGQPPTDQNPDVEIVQGTLHDDTALQAAVSHVDLVCHTAFAAKGTLEDLRRENAEGTRRLLAACCGDIRRLVFIGSPAVYASHPTPDTWPVLADAAREAHGSPNLVAYGQSMIEAEDFVLEASQRYGMEYTLLRTAITWGRNPYPQGVVTALMRNPRQAERINQAMGAIHWLHGLDAARAALLATQAEQARNQAFIVAAEQPATVFDLLAALWDITRPAEENPFSEAATTHRLPRPKFDTTKIADAIGFTPVIALRSCLEEALGMTEVTSP